MTNPSTLRRPAVLILLCSLAACGDRETTEVPPEVREARREASRVACISRELLQRAQDDLATLEGTLGPAGGSDPMAALTREAQLAAIAYARAYLYHAQLRAGSAAQQDSAVNYSRTETDSLRHAETAAQFSIRAPTPGTVEVNVIQAYERDFAQIYTDADHPCNWNFPMEEEAPR